MRILLINSPHPAIGSRIPVEHLPPLGLLAIGGPLIDDGHRVSLLDAEFGPLTVDEITAHAADWRPDAVLLGHSGSTSGHPIMMRVARAIRLRLPGVWIIYGGVFPTYHWREILDTEPQVDVIVRGEGEEVARQLMRALSIGMSLDHIQGLAFRSPLTGVPQTTGLAEPIANLDDYRIGWELIDFSRYRYWNRKCAVLVQFSRGCPHRCSYCGQRMFWRRWRHRDPRCFAAELARLHREHGVEVVNFADENPTADRAAWRAFLEALIAENVPLILVGSTRAGDIVRDTDILHLYKLAGVARFLLGMESTDEATLQKINKGATAATDREAIRLLRQHGIISLAAFVSGFAEESDRDFARTLRQILAYDPDQIQAVYVTPHRWTPLFQTLAQCRVIQTDLSQWDYKHQVMASPGLPRWRVLLWVKFIEAVAQLRPKALWRMLAHPDPAFRDAMRWYYKIGAKIWPYEIKNFLISRLFGKRRANPAPTLAEFWGRPAPVVRELALAAPVAVSDAANLEIQIPNPATKAHEPRTKPALDLTPA